MIQRKESPPAIRGWQFTVKCDACASTHSVTTPEGWNYNPGWLTVSPPDDRETMHFCGKCAPAIQRAINRECLR